MQIIIKATNIKLLPDIEEYVEQKISSLERFLENVDPNVVEARIEVGKPSKHHRKGDVFYAEVNLILPGKLLRAQSKNWDLRLAIDEVKDEMQRQIKKYKGKVRDLTRKEPSTL